MTTHRTLISAAIEGGVWSCAPVSQRPQVVLIDWRIFEVPLSGSAEPTRHFVGYNITDREGRVSSTIVQFDSTTKRGVTESGRVYELRGRAGWNSDAEYTWSRWLGINGVLATDISDVTAEIEIGRKE